jgi:hypothetical protein
VPEGNLCWQASGALIGIWSYGSFRVGLPAMAFGILNKFSVGRGSFVSMVFIFRINQ